MTNPIKCCSTSVFIVFQAAQDQRLKAVRARVQLLHAQEHQAWKDFMRAWELGSFMLQVQLSTSLGDNV